RGVITGRFLHARGVFAFGDRECLALPRVAGTRRGAVIGGEDNRLRLQIDLVKRVNSSIHLAGLSAGGRELEIEDVGVAAGPDSNGGGVGAAALLHGSEPGLVEDNGPESLHRGLSGIIARELGIGTGDTRGSAALEYERLLASGETGAGIPHQEQSLVAVVHLAALFLVEGLHV